MLGLLDILAIIKAVLNFPSTMLEFVHLLKETPQEKHDHLLKKMAEEAKKFEETGRPSWD